LGSPFDATHSAAISFASLLEGCGHCHRHGFPGDGEGRNGKPLAVAMAERPATPAPMTSTLAGCTCGAMGELVTWGTADPTAGGKGGGQGTWRPPFRCGRTLTLRTVGMFGTTHGVGVESNWGKEGESQELPPPPCLLRPCLTMTLPWAVHALYRTEGGSHPPRTPPLSTLSRDLAGGGDGLLEVAAEGIGGLQDGLVAGHVGHRGEDVVHLRPADPRDTVQRRQRGGGGGEGGGAAGPVGGWVCGGGLVTSLWSIRIPSARLPRFLSLR